MPVVPLEGDLLLFLTLGAKRASALWAKAASVTYLEDVRVPRLPEQYGEFDDADGFVTSRSSKKLADDAAGVGKPLSERPGTELLTGQFNHPLRGTYGYTQLDHPNEGVLGERIGTSKGTVPWYQADYVARNKPSDPAAGEARGVDLPVAQPSWWDRNSDWALPAGIGTGALGVGALLAHLRSRMRNDRTDEEKNKIASDLSPGTEAREELPKSDFVYKKKSPEGEPDAKGKYPIPDAAHARAALGFAAMHHGKSSPEYAAVRRKVDAKFGAGEKAAFQFKFRRPKWNDAGDAKPLAVESVKLPGVRDKFVVPGAHPDEVAGVAKRAPLGGGIVPPKPAGGDALAAEGRPAPGIEAGTDKPEIGDTWYDRNWPYLAAGMAGTAGLGGLLYALRSRARKEPEEKRADYLGRKWNEGVEGAAQWIEENPERAGNIGGDVLTNMFFTTPGRIGLGALIGAASSPKGYGMTGAARGAGYGLGAGVGAGAGTLIHNIAGNPEDLAPRLALQLGGTGLGLLAARTLMGEDPASADKIENRLKKEQLRRGEKAASDKPVAAGGGTGKPFTLRGFQFANAGGDKKRPLNELERTLAVAAKPSENASDLAVAERPHVVQPGVEKFTDPLTPWRESGAGKDVSQNWSEVPVPGNPVLGIPAGVANPMIRVQERKLDLGTLPLTGRIGSGEREVINTTATPDQVKRVMRDDPDAAWEVLERGFETGRSKGTVPLYEDPDGTLRGFDTAAAAVPKDAPGAPDVGDGRQSIPGAWWANHGDWMGPVALGAGALGAGGLAGAYLMSRLTRPKHEEKKAADEEPPRTLGPLEARAASRAAARGPQTDLKFLAAQNYSDEGMPVRGMWARAHAGEAGGDQLMEGTRFVSPGIRWGSAATAELNPFDLAALFADPRNVNAAARAYQAHVSPYQDEGHEYKEDPDLVARAYGRTQRTIMNASDVLAKDREIAGHRYNRAKHPFHYLLNPFVQSGPINEIAARLARRSAAEKADPDAALRASLYVPGVPLLRSVFSDNAAKRQKARDLGASAATLDDLGASVADVRDPAKLREFTEPEPYLDAFADSADRNKRETDKQSAALPGRPGRLALTVAPVKRSADKRIFAKRSDGPLDYLGQKGQEGLNAVGEGIGKGVDWLGNRFGRSAVQGATGGGGSLFGAGAGKFLDANPWARYALYGAPIGAGLGLVGGLMNRKKKKDALGDAMIGGLLGAGAGAGIGAGWNALFPKKDEPAAPAEAGPPQPNLPRVPGAPTTTPTRPLASRMGMSGEGAKNLDRINKQVADLEKLYPTLDPDRQALLKGVDADLQQKTKALDEARGPVSPLTGTQNRGFWETPVTSLTSRWTGTPESDPAKVLAAQQEQQGAYDRFRAGVEAVGGAPPPANNIYDSGYNPGYAQGIEGQSALGASGVIGAARGLGRLARPDWAGGNMLLDRFRTRPGPGADDVFAAVNRGATPTTPIVPRNVVEGVLGGNPGAATPAQVAAIQSAAKEVGGSRTGLLPFMTQGGRLYGSELAKNDTLVNDVAGRAKASPEAVRAQLLGQKFTAPETNLTDLVRDHVAADPAQITRARESLLKQLQAQGHPVDVRDLGDDVVRDYLRGRTGAQVPAGTVNQRLYGALGKDPAFVGRVAASAGMTPPEAQALLQTLAAGGKLPKGMGDMAGVLNAAIAADPAATVARLRASSGLGGVGEDQAKLWASNPAAPLQFRVPVPAAAGGPALSPEEIAAVGTALKGRGVDATEAQIRSALGGGRVTLPGADRSKEIADVLRSKAGPLGGARVAQTGGLVRPRGELVVGGPSTIGRLASGVKNTAFGVASPLNPTNLALGTAASLTARHAPGSTIAPDQTVLEALRSRIPGVPPQPAAPTPTPTPAVDFEKLVLPVLTKQIAAQDPKLTPEQVIAAARQKLQQMRQKPATP